MSSGSNSSLFKSYFVDRLIEVYVMADKGADFNFMSEPLLEEVPRKNAQHRDHIPSDQPNLSRGNRRTILNMSY